MTIEEMIAILTAYKEGKTIEFGCCGEWEELKEPIFDFTGKCGYRIKPEPRYRPFKSAEEVMEAIKEHGDWIRGHLNEWRIHIVGYSNECVDIGPELNLPFDCAYQRFTFADGTPFGKLEE